VLGEDRRDDIADDPLRSPVRMGDHVDFADLPLFGLDPCSVHADEALQIGFHLSDAAILHPRSPVS
jgi:hypothetical protein